MSFFFVFSSIHLHFYWLNGTHYITLPTQIDFSRSTSTPIMSQWMKSARGREEVVSQICFQRPQWKYVWFFVLVFHLMKWMNLYWRLIAKYDTTICTLKSEKMTFTGSRCRNHQIRSKFRTAYLFVVCQTLAYDLGYVLSLNDNVGIATI